MRQNFENSFRMLPLGMFAVHHGYVLSLEKKKNCMEKVLNFAYKNVYEPCTMHWLTVKYSSLIKFQD